MHGIRSICSFHINFAIYFIRIEPVLGCIHLLRWNSLVFVPVRHQCIVCTKLSDPQSMGLYIRKKMSLAYNKNCVINVFNVQFGPKSRYNIA